MKDFPLPVRMVGSGSQPVEDEELQYLEMPRDMNTFRMPLVPEAAEPDMLARARDTLAGYLAELSRWDPTAGTPGPRLNLHGTPARALTIVNEVLGEGEVSIQVAGTPAYRIQESVFTGIWRVCAIDGDGRLTADWLEAAPLPAVAV
ncbi:MAG: hydrogenase expression/formation protein, partial [Aromatoleum sp.]|nr:hydrogenase expression/formation protein [Aromatoleum sp.]